MRTNQPEGSPSKRIMHDYKWRLLTVSEDIKSFMRVDLVKFHRVEALGQFSCFLLLGQLFNHHWVDDVPCFFVELSEADVCVVFEVNHQLGLDLKDVCSGQKLLLPLLFPFSYDPIDMGNNFFLENLLFDFSVLLKLCLVTVHQFLSLHSQILLYWSQLVKGLLIVWQMLPIHTLEVLMLHNLMKSQPFTHIFFVHLQQQVSEQRTEQLRTEKHLIFQ